MKHACEKQNSWYVDRNKRIRERVKIYIHIHMGTALNIDVWASALDMNAYVMSNMGLCCKRWRNVTWTLACRVWTWAWDKMDCIGKHILMAWFIVVNFCFLWWQGNVQWSPEGMSIAMWSPKGTSIPMSPNGTNLVMRSPRGRNVWIQLLSKNLFDWNPNCNYYYRYAMHDMWIRHANGDALGGAPPYKGMRTVEIMNMDAGC